MSKPTPRHVKPVDDHLRELSRFVERLRRSCEETHLHCRRQQEMIDAQRRLLRELDARRDALRRAGRATPAVNSRGDSGGEIGDGE